MKIIDCRGLSCPAPVLQTKDAIEQEALQSIAVLVDNEASKQNVIRFLQSQGFTVSVEDKDGVFRVSGTLTQNFEPEKQAHRSQPVTPHKRQIMVMISTNRIGHGSDELGEKLMINFVKTLKEMGSDLWRIVFINNGVRLATKDSPILDDLLDLLANGVSILVCGTCLTYFDLLDKKAVGDTTNMLDIITSMQIADQVINI